MSSNIKIIDPHIHLWDPYTTPRAISPLVKIFGRFPWLLDKVARAVTPNEVVDFIGLTDHFITPHLPKVFHQDTGKYDIDGYVHIEAGWEGKKPFHVVGETNWLMTLLDKPMAIVGAVDLSDTENLEAVLDAHAAASPLFKGVRESLAQHPGNGVMDYNEPNKMQSMAFKEGYAKLAERNLSFDTFLYSHQLKDFIELVKEIPQTKVILDHIGTPIALGGPHGGLGKAAKDRAKIKATWYQDLASLAEVKHVKMKLSGLLMPVCGYLFEKRKTNATLNEVVDAIGPHTEYALKTFGVDRCMFASNFPMDKVSTSYETLYDAFFQIVESYSDADKLKLFRTNAMAFYSL